MNSSCVNFIFFFFNDTATTEIYTLSLHDALPIWVGCSAWPAGEIWTVTVVPMRTRVPSAGDWPATTVTVQISRSEEHTSELQSRSDLVCRLLLEKKKTMDNLCWLDLVDEECTDGS